MIRARQTKSLRASAGFALITMSAMVVVGGLLAGASAVIYKQVVARQYLEVNEDRIKTIRQALTAYVKTNNRLPCVAQPTLAPTNANYAQEINGGNCVTVSTVPAGTARVGTGSVPDPYVRIGAVPVRALGLSDDYFADASGKQFVYAVTEGLTSAATFPTATGAITVQDDAGAAITNSALYTLVSTGRDGVGGYTRAGTQPVACTGTSKDLENCNNSNKIFRVANYSTVAGANHFDDSAVFNMRIDETAPPTCGTNQVLSYNGTAYVCTALDGPPACPVGQVLTSTDGVNLTCVAQSPALPTCGGGQVLTNTGSGYTCVSQMAPPPSCPANYVLTNTGSGFICTLQDAPPACPAGQVLTSSSPGVFSCMTVTSTSIPTCAAGQALTSTDGINFTCVLVGSTAPLCAANYIPVSNGGSYSCMPDPGLTGCAAGSALTWDGTKYACVSSAPVPGGLYGFCLAPPSGAVQAWAPACVVGVGGCVNPSGAKCGCESGYEAIDFSNGPTKNAKAFTCMAEGQPLAAGQAQVINVMCPDGEYLTGTDAAGNAICSTGSTSSTPPTISALNDLIGVLKTADSLYIGESTTDSLPVTAGLQNTAVGVRALPSVTTGNACTAIGERALWGNSSGQFSIGLGFMAGSAATTGLANIGIGSNALSDYPPSITSNNNVAVGAWALMDVRGTGSNNTAIGETAGAVLTTGYNNTAVGKSSGPAAGGGGLVNTTAIGANAQTTVSNQVRVGDAAITQIGGQVAWTATSDRRVKKDITDSDLGLDFIKKLKPVSYRLKTGNERLDYGFIAQDVEQALEGRVTNMVVQQDDADKTYQLRATDLLAPLVKGMQEQRAIIERQRSELDAQQTQIDALEKIFSELSLPGQRQGDGQ